jgi:hypothetical protein
MFKLTKRSVEKLEVEAKDYFVWDAELIGFGVRVMPSGRKSYLIQYRAGGRSRRRSIGQHGALTADQARAEAKRLLGDVAHGGNPAEERRKKMRDPTVAALCDRSRSCYWSSVAMLWRSLSESSRWPPIGSRICSNRSFAVKFIGTA